MDADIDPDENDDGAGQVGGTPREFAESLRPAPFGMAHAQRGDRPGGHQGQGQADAEADDQRGAERDLLQLEAQQQNGDGRRAGDQPAGQAEQQDLSGGDVPAGEAALDIAGMRPFMCVLIV